MDVSYYILAIAGMSLATALLRAAPFFVSQTALEQPFIKYVGGKLPACIMMILVLYCLKDKMGNHQELTISLVGIAVVTVCHLLWRSVLLSIVAGTGAYMMLLRFMVG